MTDKRPDDLDEQLTRWGSSTPPRADGAFANRLETSLRQEIVAGADPSRNRIGSLLFRPGVVVLGIAVLLFGFALVSRSGDDEARVADGAPNEPTISSTTDEGAPETSRPEVPGPTVTTQRPDEDPNSLTTELLVDPPETTVPPTSPVTSEQPTDQTTIPAAETTVPVTDSTTPTTDAPRPEVVATLGTPADGQVAVRWRVGGDTSGVTGWVVVRTIGDSRQTAATVRDATVRRAVVDVVDRDALFRVEGRSADGDLLVQSDDVSINRDG
jgi:hypothetical protein